MSRLPRRCDETTGGGGAAGMRDSAAQFVAAGVWTMDQGDWKCLQ